MLRSGENITYSYCREAHNYVEQSNNISTNETGLSYRDGFKCGQLLFKNIWTG